MADNPSAGNKKTRYWWILITVSLLPGCARNGHAPMSEFPSDPEITAQRLLSPGTYGYQVIDTTIDVITHISIDGQMVAVRFGQDSEPIALSTLRALSMHVLSNNANGRNMFVVGDYKLPKVACCNHISYTSIVILNFRHKGLKRFFESGYVRGIPAQHEARIRRQLDVLGAAKEIGDLNLPGWGLHQLKGQRRGTWAVSVSGNWRITFRFEGGDAYVVDLEDYH